MIPTKRRLSHVQGYLELGMVAEAADELGQISADDAQRTEVVVLRLAVLHEQQKWPLVRDLAAELVGRGVADAGIWIMWAYATRRAESIENAERILLEAERRHPADPTIQFNLGCYACQRGDLRAARRFVACATALDPKFSALAATDPDLGPLRDKEAADRQTNS